MNAPIGTKKNKRINSIFGHAPKDFHRSVLMRKSAVLVACLPVEGTSRKWGGGPDFLALGSRVGTAWAHQAQDSLFRKNGRPPHVGAGTWSIKRQRIILRAGGPTPLFFMDYLAQPGQARAGGSRKKVVEVSARACKHKGCALIGGCEKLPKCLGFFTPSGEVTIWRESSSAPSKVGAETRHRAAKRPRLAKSSRTFILGMASQTGLAHQRPISLVFRNDALRRSASTPLDPTLNELKRQVGNELCLGRNPQEDIGHTVSSAWSDGGGKCYSSPCDATVTGGEGIVLVEAFNGKNLAGALGFAALALRALSKGILGRVPQSSSHLQALGKTSPQKKCPACQHGVSWHVNW